MKTLVTGATGFIGSVLVRRLLHKGVDVRILRRNTSKLDLLGEHERFVEHCVGDVLDPESLKGAMEGMETVYHAAALVAIPARNRKLAAYMHKVNVDGTANVVNAALAGGIQRVVHTSSIAALGRAGGESASSDETTAWTESFTKTPYAYSKYDAELQIHRGIAEGLDAVMVNPSLVFGPGRSGENTTALFEAVTGPRKLPVPSGSVNVVDVEDVAAGHILAMEKGRTGERYILGGENLPWAALFRMFAESMGVPVPQRKMSKKLAMIVAVLLEGGAFLVRKDPPLDRTMVRGLCQSWHISSDKAIKELGYSYRPFADTVKRMAEAATGTS